MQQASVLVVQAAFHTKSLRDLHTPITCFTSARLDPHHGRVVDPNLTTRKNTAALKVRNKEAAGFSLVPVLADEPRWTPVQHKQAVVRVSTLLLDTVN